eukprot:g6376.t1
MTSLLSNQISPTHLCGKLISRTTSRVLRLLKRVRRPIVPQTRTARVLVAISNKNHQRSISASKTSRPTVKASQSLVQSTSLQDLKFTTGSDRPLGPSKTDKGVNFAIFGRHCSSMILCLFDWSGQSLTEFQLDPSGHRSGDIWHVEVEGLPGRDILYSIKVDGVGGWETGQRWDKTKLLLDPYAPLVKSRRTFGVRDKDECFKHNEGSVFFGTFDFDSPCYDWGENYAKPNIPQKDLVIYELPIRPFTAGPTSGLPEGTRGTFAGVKEKIPHLIKLGINAVELLPVFEYDEMEFQRFKNPRDHMINIWGYSHLNFFAPMSRFATNGQGPYQASKEFKDMVCAFHKAGIEVILDVVYNHTAESDDKTHYTISYRGIDTKVYYMVDTSSYVQLINYSGCGNTVNANNPVVTQMIIDSLRHWVEEYHVDGFRFDLASCLCRDEGGRPLAAPPLIRQISKDPILQNVKLIAEPWDLGMFQVGSFPNWDRWSEWNGIFRDEVRRFVKGDGGMKKALASRLCGSADLYHKNNRKPYHSINFIVAHDGFTLYDLVSYNHKHNQANGENNNDGNNDNLSWNCGAEGETGDGGVEYLRQKQMRNMLVVLLLSQGTPMILAGDEYGHTCHGNNNWYGHDSKMTWFDWDRVENDSNGLFRFTSELIKFRRSHPALRQEKFIGHSDIIWHEDNWDNDESRFLAFTLHGGENGEVYCALNAHGFPITCHLPPPPHGQKWCRLVDTNLAPPKDFTPGGNNGVDIRYTIEAHSSIILISKPH